MLLALIWILLGILALHYDWPAPVKQHNNNSVTLYLKYMALGPIMYISLALRNFTPAYKLEELHENNESETAFDSKSGEIIKKDK